MKTIKPGNPNLESPPPVFGLDEAWACGNCGEVFQPTHPEEFRRWHEGETPVASCQCPNCGLLVTLRGRA